MNKLLEFQKEIGSIAKTQINPFFKSKYFDINILLEHIRPILNKNGLVIIQPIDVIDRDAILKTLVIDAATDAVLVESKMVLPLCTDPQKFGATITYFRRYALQSLLLLEAEDDDGNTASGKTKVQNEVKSKPEVKKPVRPFTPEVLREALQKKAKEFTIDTPFKIEDFISATQTLTNLNASKLNDFCKYIFSKKHFDALDLAEKYSVLKWSGFVKEPFKPTQEVETEFNAVLDMTGFLKEVA